MIGRDGLAGLICLGASLWLLALTRGLPQAALVPIGPGFYPRLVLVATAVLAALLVASDVLARRRRGGAGASPRARNWRLVATTFAVVGGYVFLLPLLGYRVATFLFVAALQSALEPPHGRRWLLVLVVATATTLVTYLVFEGYLSVLLPRGRWTGF